MKRKNILVSTLVAASAMSFYCVPALAEELSIANGETKTIKSDASYEKIKFTVGHDGQTGTLTINSGATLTVTGTTVAATNDTSSVALGYAGLAEFNVNGTLNVLNASGFGTTFTRFDMAIGSGGVANLKELKLTVHGNHAATSTVTLDGGRLNLGDGGYTYQCSGSGYENSHIDLTLKSGTLGALDSWSTSKTLSVGNENSVTFDTTKYDAETGQSVSGDNSGATISLTGGLTSTGTVNVSGAGTLELGGTVSLSSAIQNAGTVKLLQDVVFNLTDSLKQNADVATTAEGDAAGTVYQLINNTGSSGTTGTISLAEGFSALGLNNFTKDGAALGGRSTVSFDTTVGTVTLTEGTAANLVWAGTTGSNTWNTSSGNNPWTNNSIEDAFYTLDNVTFGASAENKNVSVAAEITAGTITIEGGEYKFSRENSGYVKANGGTTIKSGATLILATTTGETGLLRGEVTVESGGKLQFDAKDVAGWDSGTSLKKILVEEGGELYLNHTENETFAGTLELGGKLSGKTDNGTRARWDVFGGNSTIKVTSNSAEISADLAVRQSAGLTIQLGDGKALTISGNILPQAAGGSTEKLIVDAGKDTNGSFAFTGTNGDMKTGGGIHLGHGNFTVGDGENASFLSVGRIELGDSDKDGESFRESNFGINKNATLQITGSNNADSGTGDENTTGYKSNSILLGEWGTKMNATIAGTLIAKDAQVRLGDAGGTLTIGSGGTLLAKGVGQAKTFNVDKGANIFGLLLKSGGKVILGSDGMADGKKNGEAKSQGGEIGTFADSTSIAKALTLESGTTKFNTAKYTISATAIEEKVPSKQSISAGTEAGAITVSSVLSGAGALEKTGAGTLTLEGANTFTGGVTISEGILVAANASALGGSNGGAVSVSDGAKLTVNVAGVSASSVSLASGAKLVLSDNLLADVPATADADGASAVETRTLQILVSNSISLAGTQILSSNVADIESYVDYGDAFNQYANKTWSYADNTLTLTLSVPEPSAFGLLAGLGALALVASRRRRSRK